MKQKLQSIEALRRFVCMRLCNTDEVPHPFTTLRHRSGSHLRLVLQKQYPNATLRLRDADYSTPILRELNEWLRDDAVSERQYHAEYHDCDDFANAIRCKIFKIGHALKTTLTVAYCEGYSPGGYHAFNLVIDDADGIYIIEPQSDKVVPAAESTYLPDFIQL